MRTIPGMIEVQGREFFYAEVSAGEGFHKFVDPALESSPDVPLPKSGGVIEEKIRIRLNEDTTLLGISYKGDLEGWRGKFVAYCKTKHRKWSIVSRQKLVLSDGTALPLAGCKVTFED